MKVILIEAMGKAQRSPNYEKIKGAMRRLRSQSRKMGGIGSKLFDRRVASTMGHLKKYRPKHRWGHDFKYYHPNTGDKHARAQSFSSARMAGEVRRKEVNWGGGHKWNMIAAKRATNKSKKAGFKLP